MREAQRLNIPIIGLVDTDTDPDIVNLPIPATTMASAPSRRWSRS